MREEKERGVKVVVGACGVRKDIWVRPLAETFRGWEWIAAYVKVRGFVRAVTGVGMSEYAKMDATPINLRGRTRSGRRMRRATSVDRQMVPNKVEVE